VKGILLFDTLAQYTYLMYDSMVYIPINEKGKTIVSISYLTRRDNNNEVHKLTFLLYVIRQCISVPILGAWTLFARSA